LVASNKEHVMGYEQFRGRMIAPQTCAEALDNSEFTIHRWIREGKIKAVKLSSRCTRIDGDSLADFLCSRVFTPGAKEAQPEPLKRSTAKRTTHTAVELAGQA
jgi:hypothetical protein